MRPSALTKRPRTSRVASPLKKFTIRLALFASPLGEGIRSQVRHFALYDPHPPPLPCEGRGDLRAWSLFDLPERQLRIAIARHHLFQRRNSTCLDIFCRNRIDQALLLPIDRHDPPTTAVMEQLNAVNPAHERFGIVGVVAGFVRAPDMRDVPKLFRTP